MAGVQKLAGASTMFLAASIAVGLVLGTDDPYVGEGARVRHNVAAWRIFLLLAELSCSQSLRLSFAIFSWWRQVPCLWR